MQVKVLGAERRRRWSYEEKVRLIEETLQPGETVCGVARRHGLAQSLLFTWRRQARRGRLGGEAVPALVPVEITSTAASASTCAPQQPPSSPPARRAGAGIIEIELGGGCRVRVDRDVDTEALQRVTCERGLSKEICACQHFGESQRIQPGIHCFAWMLVAKRFRMMSSP